MTAWIEGGGSLTRRIDAISVDYLTGFSVGPRDLGDVSAGLLDRVWRVQLDGTQLWLSKADEANESWVVVESARDVAGLAVLEVDLAFDQNATEVICMEVLVAGEHRVFLHWYDPRVPGHVLQNLCQGRSPRLILDDAHHLSESSILLFYVSDENDCIEFRQQNDFYDVAYATPVTGIGVVYLEEVLLDRENRLQVVFSRCDSDSGSWIIDWLESSPYPVWTEPLALSTAAKLNQVTSVLVVIQSAVEPESIRTSSSMLSITLQELVIIYQFAEDTRVSAAAKVSTVALVALIIVQNQPNDDRVGSTEKISTVTLTLVVIAHNQPNDDRLGSAERLNTVDLVAL
jgi:hypothetical protein